MLDSKSCRKVSHSGVDVFRAIRIVVDAKVVERRKGRIWGSMVVGGRLLGKERAKLVNQALGEWRVYMSACADYWQQCKAGEAGDKPDPRQPACVQLYKTLEALEASL